MLTMRSTTPATVMALGSCLSSSAASIAGGEFRSTRGASKQRRDQINVEIQKLRDFLPLNASIKDRLFQLQIMSLACIFIRKYRYFPHVFNALYEKPPLIHQHNIRPSPLTFLPFKAIDECKALRGFLLMITRLGKLLYVSENASEYLGYSVEEIMCQGDSIYDIVDLRDHAAVQAELLLGPPSIASGTFPDERVFICRMNLSRTAKRHIQYHKFIIVEGRFIHPAEYYQAFGNTGENGTEGVQPIFAAYCRPLINPENAETLSIGNTGMFSAIHSMDMKFVYFDELGREHLGYQHLDGTSLYSIVHPSHIDRLAFKHRLLCQQKDGSAITLIKIQTNTVCNEFLWVHAVFVIKANVVQESTKRIRYQIHGTYQVLTPLEAATLQANEWIYAVKQSSHVGRELSKEDFSDSISPESSECDFGMGYDFVDGSSRNAGGSMIPQPAITVDIPHFAPQGANNGSRSMLIHSSPDSVSSGLSTSVPIGKSNFCYDVPTSFYASDAPDMPLPELGDNLDEFFRQVEYVPSNTHQGKNDLKWAAAAETLHPQEASAYPRQRAFDCYYSEVEAGRSQPPFRSTRHLSMQIGASECGRVSQASTGHAESYVGRGAGGVGGYHPHQRRLGSWAGLESV